MAWAARGTLKADCVGVDAVAAMTADANMKEARGGATLSVPSPTVAAAVYISCGCVLDRSGRREGGGADGGEAKNGVPRLKPTSLSVTVSSSLS